MRSLVSTPREREIRQALKDHLAPRLAEPSRVIDELAIKHGDYRVDVAVVADRLYGYEIKSNADTLKRLPEQVKQYSLVFHRMHLVTGPEHLAEALPLIPTWWGVLLASGDRDGLVGITELRPALENPKPNYRWVVRLLWREELTALLKAHGVRGYSKLKYWQVANCMLAQFTPEELTAMVTHQLRARAVWPGREPLVEGA